MSLTQCFRREKSWSSCQESNNTLYILVSNLTSIVDGWDDPRLFTLAGIQRRGVPVEALAEFLDLVPVTRRGNDNFIQMEMFDNVINKFMDVKFSRTLAVVDPVKLTITDLADDFNKAITVNKFPLDERYFFVLDAF
jgi:glutaminyl-tRNA synthetase